MREREREREDKQRERKREREREREWGGGVILKFSYEQLWYDVRWLTPP